MGKDSLGIWGLRKHAVWTFLVCKARMLCNASMALSPEWSPIWVTQASCSPLHMNQDMQGGKAQGSQAASTLRALRGSGMFTGW